MDSEDEDNLALNVKSNKDYDFETENPPIAIDFVTDDVRIGMNQLNRESEVDVQLEEIPRQAYQGSSEDDAGDSPTFTESILVEDPRSRNKKNPEARAELFDDLSPKHEFSEHVARARVEALFLGGGEDSFVSQFSRHQSDATESTFASSFQLTAEDPDAKIKKTRRKSKSKTRKELLSSVQRNEVEEPSETTGSTLISHRVDAETGDVKKKRKSKKKKRRKSQDSQASRRDHLEESAAHESELMPLSPKPSGRRKSKTKARKSRELHVDELHIVQV